MHSSLHNKDMFIILERKQNLFGRIIFRLKVRMKQAWLENLLSAVLWEADAVCCQQLSGLPTSSASRCVPRTWVLFQGCSRSTPRLLTLPPYKVWCGSFCTIKTHFSPLRREDARAGFWEKRGINWKSRKYCYISPQYPSTLLIFLCCNSPAQLKIT